MKFFKIFMFFLLLFVIPGFIFNCDNSFYQEITLPSFAPPPFLFSIWFILYILIAIVMTYLVLNYSSDELKDVKSYFVYNYIFNISFSPLFFCLNDLFLATASVFFTFVSAILLFIEVRSLNKRLSLFLIPYLIWLLFALVLMSSIYILN